jgi:hypothetical protein
MGRKLRRKNMNRKTIFALVLICLTAALYGQKAGDFVIEGTVLTKYKGTATEVIIPANLGITEIGEKAFVYNENITSVVIPAGVVTIGSHAFYHCRSLTSIKIPDGVTVIDMYTFSGCSSLKEIVIPDSVKTMEYAALTDCDELDRAFVEEIKKRFGKEVFYPEV